MLYMYVTNVQGTIIKISKKIVLFKTKSTMGNSVFSNLYIFPKKKKNAGYRRE